MILKILNMLYKDDHIIVDFTGKTCNVTNSGMCGLNIGRIQLISSHDVLIFLRQFSNGQWSWLLTGRRHVCYYLYLSLYYKKFLSYFPIIDKKEYLIISKINLVNIC